MKTLPYVLHLLLFFLAGVFLFSGIIKLFPAELFEYTFVNMGLAGWSTAPVVARLFVSLELMLGMGMLVPYRKILKPALQWAFIFLLSMSAYLIWQWISSGNEGNCGCLGMLFPMTPLQSLLKNLLLLGLLAPLLWGQKHLWLLEKKQTLYLIAGLILSLALPYVISPPAWGDFPSQEKTEGSLYLEELDSPAPFDLGKGKSVVAFMSLTCPHCRVAAYKLGVMKKKNPALPLYFFLNGEKKNEAAFFAETHTSGIPHSYMSIREGFLRNTNGSVPSIFLVNAMRTERKINYLLVRQEEIETWLAAAEKTK
jgi:hypothetical protein